MSNTKAGVSRGSASPASGGQTKDVGEAFTMLTMPPGPDIAPYHDRQIAILKSRDLGRLARSVGFSEDDLEAASGRHSRRRPGGLTLSFACLCVGAHKQEDQPARDPRNYDGHNTTSSSRSELRCPVPSHPFGDFKDKPAQDSEADAPEKHDRHHRLPLPLFTGCLRP